MPIRSSTYEPTKAEFSGFCVSRRRKKKREKIGGVGGREELRDEKRANSSFSSLVVYLSIHLPAWSFIPTFFCLPTCLPIQSIYLSMLHFLSSRHPSIYSSTFPFIYLRVHAGRPSGGTFRDHNMGLGFLGEPSSLICLWPCVSMFIMRDSCLYLQCLVLGSAEQNS